MRLDGTTRGITPTEVHPSPRRDHDLEVVLAGYEPFELRLQRQHSAWLFGNVVTGVFPGMAFDAATGALYTFRSQSLHIELAPLGRKVARGP